MRLSLKAKLTAQISLLVLVVVVATSTLYVYALIRQTLADVQRRALDDSQLLLDESSEALKQVPFPATLSAENSDDLRTFARAALNNDGRLLSFVQSAAAFSEGFEYVAVTASNREVILHDDPGRVGSRLAEVQPFDELRKAGLIRKLRILYGSPTQIYEVGLRASFGREPMAVRIGISVALLQGRLLPEIRKALVTSLAVVLLSTLTAGMLSFVVLRPLKSISHNLDRLARGELPGPVPVSRSDEWGILSSKLNLLGERIRGEKAAFVALKENLDQMLANLVDGLMFFDQQDRLVLATPVVAKFLDKPTDAILRRTPNEIFSADNPLNRLLRRAFEGRTPINSQMVEAGIVESRLGDSPIGEGKGDRRTRSVAASVVFVEEQGAAVASLVTLRDAAMRAEFQNQIDIAAKLAAIGRLSAGVAHEVRNPLNAMVLQLEVLKAKLGGEGAQLKPHLDILGSEVRRLDRVVRTFLDFTRPVELRPVETDLVALVEEVFRSAEPEATRHHVRLILERNGGTTARVDRDLMKQVLVNLVLNGCQAMPDGGDLKVSSHEIGQQVELKVADQGVGIPEEARSRVFSLYYTTKPGGTGVGLAMSYRIVQLHNGSIDFSSEQDRGTTFRLTLPR